MGMFETLWNKMANKSPEPTPQQKSAVVAINAIVGDYSAMAQEATQTSFRELYSTISTQVEYRLAEVYPVGTHEHTAAAKNVYGLLRRLAQSTSLSDVQDAIDKAKSSLDGKEVVENFGADKKQSISELASAVEDYSDRQKAISASDAFTSWCEEYVGPKTAQETPALDEIMDDGTAAPVLEGKPEGIDQCEDIPTTAGPDNVQPSVTDGTIVTAQGQVSFGVDENGNEYHEGPRQIRSGANGGVVVLCPLGHLVSNNSGKGLEWAGSAFEADLAFEPNKVVRCYGTPPKAAQAGFMATPIEEVTSAGQATDLAIEWSHWIGYQVSSWGDMADYSDYFEALAEKFPEVREEFIENAIIGGDVVAAIVEPKPCSVCGDMFRPRQNASTSDTRQLCPKCRKMTKKKAQFLDDQDPASYEMGDLMDAVSSPVADDPSLYAMDANNNIVRKGDSVFTPGGTGVIDHVDGRHVFVQFEASGVIPAKVWGYNEKEVRKTAAKNEVCNNCGSKKFHWLSAPGGKARSCAQCGSSRVTTLEPGDKGHKTADFWNPSPVAQKVLDATFAVWEANGWQDGSMVDMEKLKAALAPLVGEVSAADVLDLTDSNAHSSVKALYELRPTLQDEVNDLEYNEDGTPKTAQWVDAPNDPPSSQCGWIIDWVDDEFLEASEVGTQGPRDGDEDLSHYTMKFRLRDGDNILYYEGRMTPQCLDAYGQGYGNPLDDFGMPNAGCTTLQYSTGSPVFKTAQQSVAVGDRVTVLEDAQTADGSSLGGASGIVTEVWDSGRVVVDIWQGSAGVVLDSDQVQKTAQFGIPLEGLPLNGGFVCVNCGSTTALYRHGDFIRCHDCGETWADQEDFLNGVNGMLYGKQATGEMSQYDAENGEEWQFWRDVVDYLGGDAEIHAFDVYQGPYITYGGHQFWLGAEEATGDYVYDKTTDKVVYCPPDVLGAVTAIYELLGGGGEPNPERTAQLAGDVVCGWCGGSGTAVNNDGSHSECLVCRGSGFVAPSKGESEKMVNPDSSVAERWMDARQFYAQAGSWMDGWRDGARQAKTAQSDDYWDVVDMGEDEESEMTFYSIRGDNGENFRAIYDGNDYGTNASGSEEHYSTMDDLIAALPTSKTAGYPEVGGVCPKCEKAHLRQYAGVWSCPNCGHKTAAKADCPRCHGKGYIEGGRLDGRACHVCKGKGKVESREDCEKTSAYNFDTCPNCGTETHSDRYRGDKYNESTKRDLPDTVYEDGKQVGCSKCKSKKTSQVNRNWFDSPAGFDFSSLVGNNNIYTISDGGNHVVSGYIDSVDSDSVWVRQVQSEPATVVGFPDYQSVIQVWLDQVGKVESFDGSVLFSRTASRTSGRVMLLTQEILSKVPALYAQDGKGMDAVVFAKFFLPSSGWTWYLTELTGREGFGYVVGLESEFGYFSMDELEQVQDAYGNYVERDRYFPVGTATLNDVVSGKVAEFLMKDIVSKKWRVYPDMSADVTGWPHPVMEFETEQEAADYLKSQEKLTGVPDKPIKTAVEQKCLKCGADCTWTKDTWSDFGYWKCSKCDWDSSGKSKTAGTVLDLGAGYFLDQNALGMLMLQEPDGSRSFVEKLNRNEVHFVYGGSGKDAMVHGDVTQAVREYVYGSGYFSKGAGAKKRKAPSIPKVCAVCGTKFKTSWNAAAPATRQLCSKCRAKVKTSQMEQSCPSCGSPDWTSGGYGADPRYTCNKCGNAFNAFKEELEQYRESQDDWGVWFSDEEAKKEARRPTASMLAARPRRKRLAQQEG
jgi:hypothetical protein